jgi:hypothetical protein
MQSAARFTSIHAPPPPLWLSAIFVGLVLALLLGVLAWTYGPAGMGDRVRGWAAALFSWLALTAIAALTGFTAHFDTMPPRILLVLVPALTACFVIAYHPRMGPLLDRAPGYWLIAFQGFRVGMELILWQLARAEVIPTSMTFEGRNYDVLVGLMAPLIAWLAFERRLLSPGPVIFWNVFGIAVLANVVVIGFLSAPTRFRQFFEGPPNEMIGTFPFIWLVAFVVPLAFLGHLLSIRQLLRTLKVEQPGVRK